MKIVNLVQGTPEWHKFRKEGIGSSEIPYLLHSSPSSKAWKNLKIEKLGKPPKEVQTREMKEGKEGEIQAICYLKSLNPHLTPMCAIHSEKEYIRCSFDAIDSHTLKEVHEIKSPQAKNLEKSLMDRPLKIWEDQLRWQMMIADAPEGYLEIWDGHITHPFIYERDLEWDKKALAVAEQFWTWVQDGIMPILYEECNDAEREILIAKYRIQDEIEKTAKLEKERLKELLVSGMSTDFTLDGAKISLEPGREIVDYKKLVEDFNLSLDGYKKTSKSYWKIAL